MWLQAQSLVGLVAIPPIAWALSERRGAIAPARLARILARRPRAAGADRRPDAERAGRARRVRLGGGMVAALQAATGAGMRLVFGYLAGGPAPFDTVRPETSFILAFQALPLILVISALSKLLYHWGVLQRIVHAIGWVLQRSLGVTGPVGTSAAANVFVGMVEAPLLVRPYLASMSRGGLFATMTVGMAGVAGTVLALYATILEPTAAGRGGAPDRRLRHQRAGGADAGRADGAGPPRRRRAMRSAAADIVIDDPPHSSMDAIAQGTREGIELLVNVTAMLIVVVALVALANQLLGFVDGAARR